MKFVEAGDLRLCSAEIWRDLGTEHELVVANNGKTIAILMETSENTFEQSLCEVKRAGVLRAVSELQQRLVEQGRVGVSDREIDGEIANACVARRR